MKNIRMESMASKMAVEYFLGLDLRRSGLGSPPVFPPSPPSSPSSSREGGFPPPPPLMSSMISSISSITDVGGMKGPHFCFRRSSRDVRAKRVAVRSPNQPKAVHIGATLDWRGGKGGMRQNKVATAK